MRNRLWRMEFYIISLVTLCRLASGTLLMATDGEQLMNQTIKRKFDGGFGSYFLKKR